MPGRWWRGALKGPPRLLVGSHGTWPLGCARRGLRRSKRVARRGLPLVAGGRAELAREPMAGSYMAARRAGAAHLRAAARRSLA
eukprot:scaffold125234_cov75-Phaeocystis_antarctica.AAC.1